MTISVDRVGIESILLIRVYWGDTSTVYLYADKYIDLGGGDEYAGKILQANVISKTGQIGQSGTSETASITLDDTDGALKALYESTRLEGSPCEVYQYIVQGTPTEQLLMKGVVSSDIRWIEGERVLSFSIEGGSNRTGQDGEIGYAPAEDAFIGLNPAAVGKNWPIVFGTAVKVPAVRVEYYDDMSLEDTYHYADDTMIIVNGEQLPQTPTVIQVDIDNILFEGTIDGTLFDITEKNVPRYINTPFAARESDGDLNNPYVAWVVDGVNLSGLYTYVGSGPSGLGPYTNYCAAQIGRKCFFTNGWYETRCIDNSYTLTAAAKYCRQDWATMFSTLRNGEVVTTSTFDGWWIYKDTKVDYNAGTDYMDRYIANLYPSTTVYAVWGRRTFNNKTIWAKIPKAYYDIHLDQTITTNPGAVARHCTVIDFPQPLNSYRCENWEDSIWVTLESTLPNTPLEIVTWAIEEFTAFSMEPSDDPPVTMNFAYFETTNVLEFLRGIAYQSASTIQISGDTIRLVFLAQEPSISSLRNTHEFTDSLIVMKSLELGFRSKEEINTIHRSTYYTDYSGEESSKKIYEINQNLEKFGRQIVEDDMWALTCENPVKAITDFWGVKTGNSWKTVKLDCFLDLTDARVFDDAVFYISPFIPDGSQGLITSVIHDTDRPVVTLEIELAIKAGENVEDPTYWTLGLATCDAVTDTEGDYVPDLEPNCANWSIEIGEKTPKPLYNILMTKWPSRVVRGQSFSITLELHDSDDLLVPNQVTGIIGRMYTSCIDDCVLIKNFDLTLGTVTLTDLIIKKSMFIGRINFNVIVADKTIASGDVREWRPRHI